MVSSKNHLKTHRIARESNTRELIVNVVWILVILFLFYLSIKFIGTDNLHEKVEALGIFGPLLLIFLKASTLVFAPLGGLPIYLASGALFGFTKGLLYILIGDFIGSTVSFYISRIFGKKILHYFLSRKGTDVVKDVLTHMGTTKGFIQSRLIFIGFPEAVTYGAGLTKILYIKFIVISTLIGLIPASILVAFGEAITQNISPFVLFLLSIIIVAIMTFLLLWFYDQARKNTNSTSK